MQALPKSRLLRFVEETARGCIIATEGLLVFGRIGEERRLVALGRLLYFGTVVDAELTRFRAI